MRLSSRDREVGYQVGAIREWNYKTQEAAIRHAGPTAQALHARAQAHRARLQLIEQELEARAAPVRR